MAERIRVGVVGCGLVAQVMHLPYLRELSERIGQRDAGTNERVKL